MNDVAQFLLSHGGPLLFALVFVEQAGLPIPAAPWLLAAGALGAAGKLNSAWAVGLVILASVMADSIWFYIGRRGGQRVLGLFCRVCLAPKGCVGRTHGLFARHGVQALVAAKFLPGLGAVMPPLAGALGMSTRRFLVFDSLGSLIYGTCYVAAGFLFHNQVEDILARLNKLGLGAMVLALGLIAAYVAFKYVQWHSGLDRGIHSGNASSRTSQVAEPASMDPKPAPLLPHYPAIAAFQPVTLTLANPLGQPTPELRPSSLVETTRYE